MKSVIDKGMYDSVCVNGFKYMSSTREKLLSLRRNVLFSGSLLTIAVVLYVCTVFFPSILYNLRSGIVVISLFIYMFFVYSVMSVFKIISNIKDTLDTHYEMIMSDDNFIVKNDNNCCYRFKFSDIEQVRYSSNGHLLFIDGLYTNLYMIDNLEFSLGEVLGSRVVPLYFENECAIVEKIKSECTNNFIYVR